PGQRASYTFTGTQGQLVSLAASNVALGCGNAAFYIVNPDGSQLGGVGNCGSSSFLDRQKLPVNGTYTLFVDTNSGVTGQATVQLHNVVDVTATTSPGAPSYTTLFRSPGQRASYTFTGTQGQLVSLAASNVALGCGN